MPLGHGQWDGPKIGHAEGLALDPAASDLGFGRPLVTVFPKEDTPAELHFARARGLPFIGISGSVDEIGSEVAAYMQMPRARPGGARRRMTCGHRILRHTTLMDVVVYKHTGVVGLLLDRGAKTSTKKHWQETAHDIARRDRLDTTLTGPPP